MPYDLFSMQCNWLYLMQKQCWTVLISTFLLLPGLKMDWGERAFQGQAPKELKKMTFSVDRKWGFLGGGGGCWQIGLGNRVF